MDVLPLLRRAPLWGDGMIADTGAMYDARAAAEPARTLENLSAELLRMWGGAREAPPGEAARATTPCWAV